VRTSFDLSGLAAGWCADGRSRRNQTSSTSPGRPTIAFSPRSASTRPSSSGVRARSGWWPRSRATKASSRASAGTPSASFSRPRSVVSRALRVPVSISLMRPHPRVLRRAQSDDKTVKIWRTADWGLDKTVSEPFKSSPGSTFFRRLSCVVFPCAHRTCCRSADGFRYSCLRDQLEP